MLYKKLVKTIIPVLLLCGCAGGGGGKLRIDDTVAGRETAMAREVRQTNTHIHDVGRKGGISYAQVSKAAAGRLPMPVSAGIKNIRRIAVAAFVGNIKSLGKKVTRESDAVSIGDSVSSTITETTLVVDADFKKSVLTGMYVAFSRQIAAETGWVIIHPREILSNKYYSGLDYGETPTKKLFGLFGPSDKTSWQGAAAPGFKYITSPVFEWGAWAGTNDPNTNLGALKSLLRQTTSFTGKGQFRSADFDKFSGMIGRLTKELGVDAVFTVQNEVALLPAYSGWSLELDGVAANLWDSRPPDIAEFEFVPFLAFPPS